MWYAKLGAEKLVSGALLPYLFSHTLNCLLGCMTRLFCSFSLLNFGTYMGFPKSRPESPEEHWSPAKAFDLELQAQT